jgi:NTE family protein
MYRVAAAGRRRSRQFKRLQRMRCVLATLLEELSDDLKASEEATMLRPLADHKVYNIVHLIYRSKHYEGHSKDYQFSRLTMEDHWRAGYHDAVRMLRHQEALERPSHLEGVFTFDLTQTGRG